MKNMNRFLVGLLVMGLIAGCSSDDLAGGNKPVNPGIGPDDAAYVSVSVALPSKNARSVTEGNGGSSDGTEVGLAPENAVKKLLLVLATQNNRFGAYGIVEMAPTTGTSIRTTAKIDLTSIANFYTEAGALNPEAQSIYVYAFCNPTSELVAAIGGLSYGDEFTDLICSVDNGSAADIWADNSFLMTNASLAERKLPSSLNAWKIYDSESAAFDLSGSNNGGVDNSSSNNGGPVRVERSVARFDFRDGSPSGTPANTYNIGLGETPDLLQMQLVRMSVVNMSKQFYYLRRVSENGLKDGWSICGAETSSNYVVDTDYAFKSSQNLAVPELKNHFNYPLFDDNGKITADTRVRWDNYWIDEVLDHTEDNPEYAKADYHIWRYVTENTIPDDNNKQRSGITTGIVFKGKLLAQEALNEANPELYKVIRGQYTLPEGTEGYVYKVNGSDAVYPILYVFQNNLYVGWNAGVSVAAGKADTPQDTDLWKACYTVQTGDKTPHQLYQELVQADKDGGDVDAALEAFRKAATTAGFTLYQASSDGADNPGDRYDAGIGYYCYYYYWNRHNDNENAVTMGTMEFATVRNNVYKLAVTGISKLGHPRISGNDPDPVDPEDPNEKGDRYLTVSVDVLPWVVRENNIEF